MWVLQRSVNQDGVAEEEIDDLCWDLAYGEADADDDKMEIHLDSDPPPAAPAMPPDLSWTDVDFGASFGVQWGIGSIRFYMADNRFEATCANRLCLEQIFKYSRLNRNHWLYKMQHAQANGKVHHFSFFAVSFARQCFCLLNGFQRL